MSWSALAFQTRPRAFKGVRNMKIYVKKEVGSVSYTFEIEDEKDVNALFTAGFLGSTPDTCGECGSKEVELQGSKAQGYTFIKVVCKKCGARAQMGQYKEGGMFWKKFEKYEPKESK